MDVVKAHEACTANRDALQKSKLCGCFDCLEVFQPSEITEYLADGTALCPHCRVDSVIGDASGFPVTKDFLEKMKKYWF